MRTALLPMWLLAVAMVMVALSKSDSNSEVPVRPVTVHILPTTVVTGPGVAGLALDNRQAS